MSDKWTLNQQSFDELLTWLSPDREQAGLKYEEIRKALIRLFICRGCAMPEELADESINRVAKRVPEIKDVYKGDPALYFYGVAKKVYLEYLKIPRPPAPPLVIEQSDDIEREHQCLEQCVERLEPENRALVIRYYQNDQHGKILHRKKLAEQSGIGLNALRIRAHRIRATLRKCLFSCLEEGIMERVH